MSGQFIFLLGGARSGKSRWAEDWAAQQGGRVLFWATAQAFDEDMRERIARHRQSRLPHWATVEAPLGAEAALRPHLMGGGYQTVLVDCLTLLATNALLTLPEEASQADSDRVILAEVAELLALQKDYPGLHWLVVSNEVGMGVVPPTTLGRHFQDSLGRANQAVAAAASQVKLLVAGLAWTLKP
jgi:adenosylcobinamide kinase/adenosylcobinamide-phosphate guanylyltransferase